MPRLHDPRSRASRILALLAAAPGEPMPIQVLAGHLGQPPAVIAQTLASATRSPGRNSPWRRVRRVGPGQWMLAPDTSPSARESPEGALPQPGYAGEPRREWVALHQGPGAVALRGPDGRLWIARPAEAS